MTQTSFQRVNCPVDLTVLRLWRTRGGCVVAVTVSCSNTGYIAFSEWCTLKCMEKKLVQIRKKKSSSEDKSLSIQSVFLSMADV